MAGGSFKTLIRALAVLAVVLWAAVGVAKLTLPKSRPPIKAGFPDPGKCDAYQRFTGATLVAHAGGGLPDGTYRNSRAAIDRALEHGFRYIELDFRLEGGEIVLGREDRPQSDLSFPDLLDWLRANPEVSIITDWKDDNVPHLAAMREVASDLAPRFMPQIYNPSEYAAVSQMGFGPIIFTSYNMPKDDWRETVNQLDLWAVTIPASREYLKEGIRHPVFLHTVNRPMKADGLYTDCLIP